MGLEDVPALCPLGRHVLGSTPAVGFSPLRRLRGMAWRASESLGVVSYDAPSAAPHSFQPDKCVSSGLLER